MSAPFDPFALRGDPFPAYAAARRAGGALLGHPPFPEIENALYLFRHAQVVEALKHPQLLQAPPGTYEAVRQNLTSNRVWAVLVRSMLLADPPRHGGLRRPLALSMAPGRAAEIVEGMRAQARALLSDLAERGRFDAVADFATPLVVAVLGRMMGFPLPELRALKRATAEIAQALDLRRSPLSAETNEACAWLEDEIEAALRRGSVEPGSLAAAMLAEEAAGRWDHADVIGNLVLVLLGGQETTIDAFGNILLLLESEPEQRRMLERGGIGWMQAAEELLRLGTSIHYAGARIAAADFELDGVAIAAGSAVVPVVASASRDSAVFPAGDSLDLASRPRGITTFGTGMHVCLGQHLARVEIAVLLETLFAGAPRWRIEPDGVRQRGLLLFRGPVALPVTA